MADTMILLSRPFAICKFMFMFGLKTISVIVETLVELLKNSIILHVNMLGKSFIWLLALVSLPLRVLTALQRERMLEENLHELQNEMASLLWEKKQLTVKFQACIKECKILEMMLAEVEEENDRAIAKIEQLESQVKNMKFENFQLKEIEEKGYWDMKECDGKDGSQNVDEDYGLSNKIQTRKSKRSEGLVQDLTKRKDEQEGKNDTKSHSVRDEKKELAVQQSLFSAVLSLFVGMIIWQAEDACMPLVVALFMVVALSLKSVVQFFSTIENKPASDAVALLSFNWFVLGTLTYPTLPKVARVVAPLAVRSIDQVLRCVGIYSR